MEPRLHEQPTTGGIDFMQGEGKCNLLGGVITPSKILSELEVQAF